MPDAFSGPAVGITAIFSSDFWNCFDDIASPKLATGRTASVRFSPISIASTGRSESSRPAVRQRDNWEGDGQSTILFDKYAESHPGSVVYSVDCNPQGTALCPIALNEL